MVEVRLARPEELSRCLAVRRLVFTEEQGIPEAIDADGEDPHNTHWLALSGRRAVGTARMHLVDDRTAKAQRVAVLAESRRSGAGRALMRALEQHAQWLGAHEVVLDAQLSSRQFYDDLGYVAVGEEFIEAGLPHVRMRRSVRATGAPGRIEILGPQRPEPNLAEVLRSVDARGPIVAITAGWRHDERHDQALREVVGPGVEVIPLYSWFDDAHRAAPAVSGPHRAHQRSIRQLKALHRLRLRGALNTARRLAARAAQGEVHAAGELEDALATVAALDLRFADQVRAINDSRRGEHAPWRHPVTRRYRDRAAVQLGQAGTVLIAGGHIGVLMSRMEFFGVPAMLRAAHERGALIVGWSAGAMALTDRVVLFHDDTPEGPGDPEVFGPGIGLWPGVVVLPHARTRLNLKDEARVALMARRFAPATCVGMENRSRLARLEDGTLANTANPDAAVRLDTDGTVHSIAHLPGT
jgi:predicted GNAT family N-acyltransferase